MIFETLVYKKLLSLTKRIARLDLRMLRDPKVLCKLRKGLLGLLVPESTAASFFSH